MKHLDPDAETRKIVKQISPLIAAAIADVCRPAPAPGPSPYERDVMAACKAIGTAVDNLEQAQFAKQSEYGARMALERHARALRKLMQENRARRHDR